MYQEELINGYQFGIIFQEKALCSVEQLRLLKKMMFQITNFTSRTLFLMLK